MMGVESESRIPEEATDFLIFSVPPDSFANSICLLISANVSSGLRSSPLCINKLIVETLSSML